MLRLLLTDPDGNSSCHTLPDATEAAYSIGRSPECDICLPSDNGLSRCHAHILCHEGVWSIRDNNSVNGICVGRIPVLFTSLSIGTVIRLGASQLQVLPPEEPPTLAPRFRARSVRRAGAAAAPRRMHLSTKQARPESTMASEWGLPCDFPFSFRLEEPCGSVTAGSVLRFAFSAARNCYVWLLLHDAEGRGCLLLPTQAGELCRLRAGRTAVLPPKTLLPGDDLIAAAPFGTETLVALACTEACDVAGVAEALLSQELCSAEAGDWECRIIESCRTEVPDALWSAALLHVETTA